jgi:hypothetical protein
MSAVIRSPERLSAVPTDRPDTGTNQRRIEDAFRLLGMAAARIVTEPNPKSFVLDLAAQNGILQAVWCRDEISSAALPCITPVEPSAITAGAFGVVNSERYVRAQKALSTLLLELSRPEGTTAASLHIRGLAGEIDDDIRGECRRQWRF